MDKKTIIEETEKYYLPVFGRYPMVMVLGQGCRVWDNEGNEYVDAFAGIAVNSLGYNHPVLVKAISEQASKLMHCSNLYYTEIQAKTPDGQAKIIPQYALTGTPYDGGHALKITVR